MMNSKTIIVSMIAAVIAVVGVIGLSNQAQAAAKNVYTYVSTSGTYKGTSGVYVYPNNGQRLPMTNRVKVTPFKDFWNVIKYTR